MSIHHFVLLTINNIKKKRFKLGLLPEPEGGPGLVVLLHCSGILRGDFAPPKKPRPLSFRLEEHVGVRGITGTELSELPKKLACVFD